MKIYNTLTRKIEDFKSIKDGFVGFYTCGPTVYHYAHIGNIRNYIGHDILQRALEYNGYEVKRVMNITDVGHLSSDGDTGDDKMVKSAKTEHKSVMEIAKYYTDAFFKDFTSVNCKMPSVIEPATNLIDDYINIIQKLIDTNYAYSAGGNVYFDTSKLNNYYKLTNNNIESLEVGVRDDVLVDINKRNKSDFVLWFTKSKFDDQDLKWNSPFGVGYPGWHMECTGISIKHLGEYLDIHGGGVDNIFPHHTNEIAQSESYLGHKWCNYWFHNEFLNDESGKMSKSKGAVLTVSLLIEKGYDPLAFRFMCLNSHYRKQLVFSYEALDKASVTYNKLINRISLLKEDGLVNNRDFDNYNNKFKEAINDDLNTANAITILYDVIKSDINNSTKLKLIDNFDKVLAIDLLKEEEVLDDYNILKKIEDRNDAKKSKNFELADSIRDELKKQGIVLIDSREGTIYKKEK